MLSFKANTAVNAVNWLLQIVKTVFRQSANSPLAVLRQFSGRFQAVLRQLLAVVRIALPCRLRGFQSLSSLYFVFFLCIKKPNQIDWVPLVPLEYWISYFGGYIF